jgi:hypothetical protein
MLFFSDVAISITSNVASRMAPCFNGPSDGKFPITRSGDGARWGWGAEGNRASIGMLVLSLLRGQE